MLPAAQRFSVSNQYHQINHITEGWHYLRNNYGRLATLGNQLIDCLLQLGRRSSQLIRVYRDVGRINYVVSLLLSFTKLDYRIIRLDGF